MRISYTKYVHIKIPQPGSLFQLVEAKCIPTGKTRTREDGEIEALFFLISTNHPERYVWATRNEIY
jgi:hypothetical protein